MAVGLARKHANRGPAHAALEQGVPPRGGLLPSSRAAAAVGKADSSLAGSPPPRCRKALRRAPTRSPLNAPGPCNRPLSSRKPHEPEKNPESRAANKSAASSPAPALPAPPVPHAEATAELTNWTVSASIAHSPLRPSALASGKGPRYRKWPAAEALLGWTRRPRMLCRRSSGHRLAEQGAIRGWSKIHRHTCPHPQDTNGAATELGSSGWIVEFGEGTLDQTLWNHNRSDSGRWQVTQPIQIGLGASGQLSTREQLALRKQFQEAAAGNPRAEDGSARILECACNPGNASCCCGHSKRSSDHLTGAGCAKELAVGLVDGHP